MASMNLIEKTNYLFKTLSDVLDIILIEKIREEQSGVYTIRAQASTTKNPYNNYGLSFSFPCKPENSDTLTNMVYDILKAIQTQGISDEHFEKVIETQKRDLEVKIKENGHWMGALKYSYQYGYDPDEIINYEERIDAITKEEVQSIAKNYIDFNNYIYLRLLPEK